jgi:hypothetical protein
MQDTPLVPINKVKVSYPSADPIDGCSFSRTIYEKHIDLFDESNDNETSSSSTLKRKRSSSMDISRSIKN